MKSEENTETVYEVKPDDFTNLTKFALATELATQNNQKLEKENKNLKQENQRSTLERENAMQTARQQAEKEVADEKNALEYRANSLGDLGKLPTDALTMLNSIAGRKIFPKIYKNQQVKIDKIIAYSTWKILTGEKVKKGKLTEKDEILQAIVHNAKDIADKLGLPTNSITKHRVKAVIKVLEKQLNPATIAPSMPRATATHDTYEHKPADTDYSVGLKIPSGTTLSGEDDDALRDWNFMSDFEKRELMLKKLLRELSFSR